jgi:hypothetical protein
LEAIKLPEKTLYTLNPFLQNSKKKSKMKMNSLMIAAFFGVLASFFTTSEGFGALTLTLGTTAYVLTGTQTAVAIAGLAALAIAKEKLIIAALSNQSARGKRSVQDVEMAKSANFDAFFRAIGENDVTDCGKFLVCNVMATPVESHHQEEKLIANLFDDLEHIDPNSNIAAYQFAAYVGTLRNPDLCRERYARCPSSVEDLLEIVEAHVGNGV